MLDNVARSSGSGYPVMMVTSKEASGSETADQPFRKLDQRSTLFGASMAHALHDGMADGLYVLLPLWTQAFGLTYTQAGSLRTAFYGALTVLQMPARMLAERMGE